MKNMILSLVALAICIVVSIIVTRFLLRKKKVKIRYRIIIAILHSLVLFMATSIIYFMVYYHADESVKGYLQNSESVKVSENDTAWFFDGEGSDKALIFYPGGKVEESAYAPILHKLAEKGVDCFLVKMPFRMAIFGVNKADDIIAAYDYDEFYIGGHSLGGTMAASYAAGHSHDLRGVIMFAAYSTDELDDSLKYFSIYGSCDEVMSRNSYEKYKSNWPKGAMELVIDGGNHSQFGNYGFQKGDGEAARLPPGLPFSMLPRIVLPGSDDQLWLQCDIFPALHSGFRQNPGASGRGILPGFCRTTLGTWGSHLARGAWSLHGGRTFPGCGSSFFLFRQFPVRRT